MASDSQVARSATAFGVLLGAIASLPLVAAMVGLWAHGWVPTGDDAVIAWRSFGVLTGSGPLVGHVNQAGGLHPVYDPGPMEEWVLSLPLRLAPGGIGAVVGVTLVEVGAVVAMAVAVSRTVGRVAAVIVVSGSLLGAWSAAAVLADPVWNPFAALVPFAAMLVLGWVVATGALGWWPVVVGLASYCAQCHLVYAPAAVAVAVIAPLAGVSVRARGRPGSAVPWRWSVAGVAVGVVLWAAPVWQQLTGRPGNLASIWDATIGVRHPVIGWWAALDQLGRGLGPLPDWLRPPRGNPSGLALLVLHGRQGWTVAALVLLGALVAVAVVCREPEVAALGLVALVADAGGLAALAGTPQADALVLSYLTWIVWPLGMLTWFALGWGTYRLATGTGAGTGGAGARVTWLVRGRGLRGQWVAAAALAAAAVAVASVVGTSVERWDPVDGASVRANGQAGLAIAHLVVASGLPQHQRVRVEVDDPVRFELGPAIAYQLVLDGRHPTLSALADQLAPADRARSGDAVLFVDPRAVARPGVRRLGVASVRDPDGAWQSWTVSYRAPR